MVEFKDAESQLKQIEKTLQASVEKNVLEEKFIEEANNQYEINLVAFKKYLPDIYDKYINFSPKENFNLFLNDNGTPNLVDYDTNCPIYSADPISQVKDQVENAIKSPVFSKISYHYLEKLDNQYDFIHVDLIKSAGKVYNKARNSLEVNTELRGKVPSSVIFGVGLGYHLNALVDAVPSEYINLFEPEEDYFFASLFTFDWASYLKKIDDKGLSLYLSVGVDEEGVYKELYSRAQEQGPFIISNSWFFQHYPSLSINNLILKLKDNFHEFFMGWGFIDDAFMSLAHSCENVKRQLPMFRARYDVENQFKDFPVFIVANGPSLDNDIEFIKKFRDDVIVVSCNSASTALIKNGIVPDFHAALERSRATYDFLKAFLPEDARKQMSLLTVNVMHQDVASLFSWAGAALKGREAGTSLHQVAEIFSQREPSATIPFCNPLVGNMALSYIVSLGFKNIYMFGVDNGYVDPAHHHSKSSMYYNSEGDTVYQPLQIGSQLRVPGNFGKEVIADHFLYSGKVQMERVLRTGRAQGVSCFNCSDGSFVEGTTPLRSDDIILSSDTRRRENVIDYVKSELFYTPDKDFDLEEYLDFEGFEKLCSTMIEILSEPVSVRSEAFEQVMKQIRLLMSLKETQFSHHFMVLEGEALYLNSIIINMLFNYGDDESIMPFYQELKGVWCDFLENAPSLYRKNWNKASDHVFEV